MTENRFAELLIGTGLNEASAAWFFSLNIWTVTRWKAGRGEPSSEVIAELERLYSEQVRMAAEIIERWEADGGGRRVILETSRSEAEAQSRGWPSLAAEATVARMVQTTVETMDVKLSARAEASQRENPSRDDFNIFDDYDR